MNKNLYRQAMDNIKTSSDFVEYTMAFLENSKNKDKKKSFPQRRILITGIGACAAIMILFVVYWTKFPNIDFYDSLHPATQPDMTPKESSDTKSDPDIASDDPSNDKMDPNDSTLTKSSNATIEYVDDAPYGESLYDLIYLTEGEILGLGLSKDSSLKQLRKTSIIYGTVEDIQNIKITMGVGNENTFGEVKDGDKEMEELLGFKMSGNDIYHFIHYNAILSVKVEERLKGDNAIGSTMKILLPCPIDFNGYWQSDTEIISQVKIGMKGVFIAFAYDENSIWEENGATLYQNEICEYGMGDGQRYAFLDVGDRIVYDENSFPSLNKPQTLEDVKTYIYKMIDGQK